MTCDVQAKPKPSRVESRPHCCVKRCRSWGPLNGPLTRPRDACDGPVDLRSAASTANGRTHDGPSPPVALVPVQGVRMVVACRPRRAMMYRRILSALKETPKTLYAVPIQRPLIMLPLLLLRAPSCSQIPCAVCSAAGVMTPCPSRYAMPGHTCTVHRSSISYTDDSVVPCINKPSCTRRGAFGAYSHTIRILPVCKRPRVRKTYRLSSCQPPVSR